MGTSHLASIQRSRFIESTVPVYPGYITITEVHQKAIDTGFPDCHRRKTQRYLEALVEVGVILREKDAEGVWKYNKAGIVGGECGGRVRLPEGQVIINFVAARLLKNFNFGVYQNEVNKTLEKVDAHVDRIKRYQPCSILRYFFEAVDNDLHAMNNLERLIEHNFRASNDRLLNLAA
ncbi:MAG: hypothetical protein ACJAS1_001863 [Oleiphilaceae bacterium]|jgi:hypothetical protein